MSQSEPSSEIVETDNTHTVVLLRGEQDLSSAVDLTDMLARAISVGAGDLVIDLRGVQFMDAATVGVVLQAREHLAKQGRTLVLRAPSSPARRLIDLCGIEGLLESSTRDAMVPREHRTGALGSWVEVTPTARVDGCSHVVPTQNERAGSEDSIRARAPAVDEHART